MVALTGAIAKAFESRNYRLFWYSSLSTNIGTWVNRTAIQWLTWEITHSFTWLGVMGATSLLPTLFFGPIAGTTADRYGHRAQLILSTAIGGTISLVVALLVLFDAIPVGVLLALTILLGTSRAFTVPARTALIRSLVDRAHMSAAMGVGAATYNGSVFVGPALGGAMILWAGVSAAFLVYVAGAAITAIVLSMIKLPPRQPPAKDRESFATEFKQGFSYAFAHTGIRAMLLMTSLMALFIQPYQEILSGVAGEVFAGGAGVFTLMFTAAGFGAMSGGLWIAWRGRTQGLTRIQLVTVVCALASLAVFPSASVLWLSLISLVVMGFSLVAAGSAAVSLIQNAVEQRIRARVLALNTMVITGLPALSTLVIGTAASLFGVQAPLTIAAVLGLLVWMLSAREVRRNAAMLESTDDDEDPNAAAVPRPRIGPADSRQQVPGT